MNGINVNIICFLRDENLEIYFYVDDLCKIFFRKRNYSIWGGIMKLNDLYDL